MLKERIFRSFVSNVLIAFVILGIFGITYFTVDRPVKALPQGAINRGSSATKIALVFGVDDSAEYLDDILDILDKNNVNATFFVTGTWIVKNDEMLQRIANSGGELGNSGYFKKDFATAQSASTKEELLATHKLVQAITGVDMVNFMPPTGTYNQDTIATATALGYSTIIPSIDTMDWKYSDGATVVDRATKDTVAGDFVLMHPTKVVKDNLSTIIAKLKDKKLVISGLSETIAAD